MYADLFSGSSLFGVVQMVSQTESVSHKDWTLLYTALYNYCAGVGIAARSGDRPGGAGVQMLGRDMYLHIVSYLENRVQTIYAGAEDLEDEPLLQYYRKQWERYTDGAQYVNHLCSYLNRRWISYEQHNGRLDVHTINTVCVILVSSSGLASQRGTSLPFAD